jgi:acetyl-CoA acyltransferase 1
LFSPAADVYLLSLASFLAGFPESVPVHTVNRQCSSGLQALAHVAASINAGYYDIGIAAGVESMSLSAFQWEGTLNPKVFINKQTKDCLVRLH